MRAPLVLAPLLAGCVTVSWGRESRHEPIPAEALARLQRDATELGECLDAFGAPLWVWEHVDDGREGAVLAYGWFHERALGLGVSVPVSDYGNVSFDYDQIDNRMRGVVLFFDQDWKLTDWREGLLIDLTSTLRRRRPSVPTEDLEERT